MMLRIVQMRGLTIMQASGGFTKHFFAINAKNNVCNSL